MCVCASVLVRVGVRARVCVCVRVCHHVDDASFAHLAIVPIREKHRGGLIPH